MKKFSCEENKAWTPTSVVPDCVSEDTTLSTYDVEATISYRSSAPIPDYCPDVYAQTVEQYQVCLLSPSLTYAFMMNSILNRFRNRLAKFFPKSALTELETWIFR